MNCLEQSRPSPVLEPFVLLEQNKGIIKHPKLWSTSLINCYLVIYDIFICQTVVEKQYHIQSCVVVLNISTLWCLWLHHSSADVQYSNTILTVVLIKHTPSLPEAFGKEIANRPYSLAAVSVRFLYVQAQSGTSWPPGRVSTQSSGSSVRPWSPKRARRRRRPPTLSPHAAVPSKPNIKNYRSQQKWFGTKREEVGEGGKGSEGGNSYKRRGLQIYFLSL